MKIKNLLILSSLAFLTYGCQEDDFSKVTPTPGAEVQFGVSLEESKEARTIYGDKDETNRYFPIYWLKGDQVKVTSPQAQTGRQQGVYQVPDEADMRNYAGELSKVGEAGVQWGDALTADFYSVYPAGESVAQGDQTSFTLSMPLTQYNTLQAGKTVAMPGMDACFMYAKTANVANGTTVNLAYKPLSTAIRFVVKGPSKNTSEKLMIQSVKLSAPSTTYLSGDFTVQLANGTPVVTGVTNATNEVDVRAYNPSTGAYLTLGQDDTMELNAFIIPQEVSVKDWMVTVTLADGRAFKKSIKETDLSGKGLLKPGMIHYLPELPALDLDDTSEWDPATWMRNIPRNVYLSEISIPGSWNSLNSASQVNTSIIEQYKIGVRAFHLDSRYNTTRTGFLLNYTYTLTDLAIADGVADAWDANYGTNITTTGKAMNGAPTFKSSLKTITDQVKDDEYMMVFVTFAQNSATKQGETWEEAVDKVCKENSKVINAKDLSQKSVVGDVLGRVIVVVNSDDNVRTLNDSKCFFTKMPMTLNKDTYTTSNYTISPLLFGNQAGSGITLYGTHAQISTKDTYAGEDRTNVDNRGYVPTMGERTTKAGNILTWSKENYARPDYAHSAWIYLGLGGYLTEYKWSGWKEVSGSQATVASTFNPWINTKVNEMGNNGVNFYPVGIVLMNHVNNYADVVKNILLLNNKYRKAYDPDWTPGGGNAGQSDIQSAANGFNSGFKDGNVNACSRKKNR